MSRKKDRNKSLNNNYLKIIRSSKNEPDLIIKRIFSQLEATEIRKYSRQIYNDVMFSKILLKSQPNERDFYRKLYIDLNLESTLRWVETILINQKEQLEEYIELERNVTNLILGDQFSKAIPLLSLFREKYGASYAINQIFAYLYYRHSGVEKRREFVLSLKSEKNKNIYNFILESLNNRNDNINTYALINSELNSKIDEAFSDDYDFLSFLKYKALPIEYHQKLCLKSILNYEMNSSVVDLYKSYLYVCSLAINKDKKTKDAFTESILFVKNKINDRKLINLSFSLGYLGDMKYLVNSDDIKFIDLYTSGKYKEVCNMFEENRKMFSSFNFFELYTRSLIRSTDNDSKINSSFLNETMELILRKEGLNTNKILSQSFSLSCLDWFLDQHIFCYTNNRETNSETFKFFKSLYFIRSDIFSAFKCNYLGLEETNYVLDGLNEFDNNSSSLNLYKLYISNDDKSKLITQLDIAEERKYKYIALHLYAIGDYDNALRYFEDMYNSNDSINRMESINGLISCYLKLKLTIKAAKLACEILILKGISGINLPLDDICESVKKIVNKEFSIFFPLCLYLHGKSHTDEYHNTLKLSFEKYILNYNGKSFKNIFNIEHGVRDEFVYYFLENIYVPNVMKGPLLFENALEIENIRIEICQFLIEKEKGNKEAIEKELKERSKKLVLKNLKNHIDSNKIYVDIDYIKDKIQDECRKIYSDYLTNIKANSKHEYKELNDVMNLLRERSEFQNYNSYVIFRNVHVQSTNLFEHSKVLHSIIRKVRDEFTRGIKGLSGYLSTRIKHGALEKHLLKAFKEVEPGVYNQYNLIKNSETTEFKYLWSEVFGVQETIKAKKLDKAINNFYQGFEKILFTEVIDEWLQVSQYDLDFFQLTKKNSRPLFDYSIHNLTLAEIESKINLTTSFETLWEMIIDWLWVITDYSLEDAKDRFNIELCDKLKKLYDDLTESIYDIRLDNSSLYQELTTEVAKCKQRMLNSVREASKWFSRNTQDMTKPIDIELIVEVVTLSLGIKINSKIEKNLSIDGKFSTCYIDILYNLLSNSIKYSYLEQEKLSISLTIRNEKDKILIKVINNCLDNIKYETDNAKIKKYENIYEVEESLDRLEEQGESGYYKIQKIIKEDLNKNYICKLQYNSRYEFSSLLEIS